MTEDERKAGPVPGAPERPARPRRYRLEDLLAESDFSRPRSAEREWVDAPRAGRELI